MSFTADELSAQALRTSLWRMRGRLPTILDRDDLKQEGLIGLWKAEGRVDRERPEHEQLKFLRVTAEGAMRDAVRRARLVGRKEADPLMNDIEDAYGLFIDADQESHVQTVQACEAIMTMPAPLPLVALMRLAGVETTLIASHLGVSASRISQLLKAVAEKLESSVGHRQQEPRYAPT